MTSGRRLERDVPDLLAGLYLGPIPDYRDDVIDRTSRMRQRPAWTFPERWLPMDFVDRRRVVVPRLPWRAIGVLALLALLLALVIAAYVGSRRTVAPPFGPARNGQILYSSAGDIFVRDRVDGSARPLISDPARDEAPTFSRQGDQFSFFRVVTDTTLDVWVARADGSGARRLGGPFPNPNAWDWSPDGHSILTVFDVKGVATISIIPIDGSPIRALSPGMPASGALWRPPTGGQILFRGGNPEGDGALYLIKPDGSGLTKLVLPSEGIGGLHDYTHGVGWSPDGRYLTYETVDAHDTSAKGVGLRMHLAEIDPTGVVLSDRRLEFDHQADDELNPAWLPAGDRLVFQTREGSSDYLNVAPVPGPTLHSELGTARKVGPTSNAGGGIGYEIAPDGRSLLVLFWTEQKTWRYDLDALSASPADLGPLDIASFQRLAP